MSDAPNVRDISDQWPGATRAVSMGGPARKWRCEECGEKVYRDSGRCSNDECPTHGDADE